MSPVKAKWATKMAEKAVDMNQHSQKAHQTQDYGPNASWPAMLSKACRLSGLDFEASLLNEEFY